MRRKESSASAEARRARQRRAYRQESPTQRAARLADHRAYRLRHKERIALRDKARRKAYRQANLEKCRADGRAQRLKFVEDRRARARAWRAAHPEKNRATERAYKTRHAERIRQQQRAWREANAAQERARHKAYQRAHPEVYQESQRRRRAKKKGTPENTLTAAQWREIQGAQDHRCAYCGKRCKGRLTQDHIVPLSQGGTHTLHNVIGACRSCNSKKNDGPPLLSVQPLLLTIAPARKKKIS